MPSSARGWALRLGYLVWINAPVLRPLIDRVFSHLFEAAAEGWEARTESHRPDGMSALAAGLEQIAKTPTRIVDLGCGTGTVAIELAGRYPNAWVIGIDISPRMIKLAARNARAAGAAVSTRVGRAQATGLPDAEADLVVLMNALPAFEEIARILAPGGHAIVVASMGARTPFYSGPRRLERGFARYGVRQVAHGRVASGEYFVAVKR